MNKNKIISALEKVSELTTKVAGGTMFVIRQATYDREAKSFEIVPVKKDMIILADDEGIKNIEVAYNAAISSEYPFEIFKNFKDMNKKYDLSDKRIAKIVEEFAV